MIIKIKCPICTASNKLMETNLQCRRCKNDLSRIYVIKYHSYYNRIKTIMSIVKKDYNEAEKNLTKAVKFSTEI